MIIINGTSLTVEQVAAVARTGEQVAISDEAKAAVNKARAYVEKKLDEKAVVYGLTTGFGKFSDKYIPLEDTAALQRNLIISHSCGMGNPLPTEVVRAAMLLRCNALCRGNSGIRLSTIETLLSMLNKGVHPIVPEKGSLGASGDLAPLSHMVLVMLGEGRAEYKGEIMYWLVLLSPSVSHSLSRPDFVSAVVSVQHLLSQLDFVSVLHMVVSGHTLLPCRPVFSFQSYRKFLPCRLLLLLLLHSSFSLP